MEPSGSRTAEEGGSEVSRDGRIALGGPAAGARAQSPVDQRIRRRARGGLRYEGPDLPGEAALGGVRRGPARGRSHRDPPSEPGHARGSGPGPVLVRFGFDPDSGLVQLDSNPGFSPILVQFWFSPNLHNTVRTWYGARVLRTMEGV